MDDLGEGIRDARQGMTAQLDRLISALRGKTVNMSA